MKKVSKDIKNPICCIPVGIMGVGSGTRHKDGSKMGR
jgi:hypothetical protein